MVKTRLQNISDVILQGLRAQTQEKIEEQVYILFDGIVDLIQKIGDSTILDGCEELFHYLNETWQYRDFDGLSQETSFLMGSIWGAMKTAETSRKRSMEEMNIQDLISKYDDYYWLFDAIAKSPGIRHKSLAAKGAKSPSELSQFVSRMESENLLMYSRTGREKYYYLQEKGRKVYEGIKKAKRPADIPNADWLKRIVEDNDSLVRKINNEHDEAFVAVTVHPCHSVFEGMFSNVGNIQESYWKEMRNNMKLLNRHYIVAPEMLYDNVLAVPIENVFSGSSLSPVYCNERIRQRAFAEV